MPLNILDFVRLADQAWCQLMVKTIENCFRKAAVVKKVENEIVSDEEQETSAEP